MNVTRIRFALLGWLMFLLCTTPSPSREASATPLQGGPGETPCITEMQIVDLENWLPKGDAGGDEEKFGNEPLIVLVRWMSLGGGGGGPKHINVKINPSSFTGQSLNSGMQNLEDFAIEALDNADWELKPPDLAYDNAQSIEADTREPKEELDPVEIRIRAYDWRGTLEITATAEGCDPVTMSAPADFDDDKLPDAFEKIAFFNIIDDDGKVQTLQFNEGLAKSHPNMKAPTDAEDDSDLDNRATKKHKKFGDGLTAYEEYNAVKVSGKVDRTTNLTNDGPGGGKGGTHLKDVFIFDENKAHFKKDNKFLEDYKIIWHLIADGDMTKPGDKIAGFIDFTGPAANSSQRAIWLAPVDKALNFPGGIRLIADARDRSINASGVQIVFDVPLINDIATKSGIPAERLLNWAAAHEIGHKLSLEHVKRFRDRVAAEPKPPNLDKFWVTAGKRMTNIQVPVIKPGGKANVLERFLRYEPDQPWKPGTVMPVKPTPGGVKADRHGEDHDTGSVRVINAPNELPDSVKKLVVEGHLKTLMDFSPHPEDLEDVEKNPLLDAATPDKLNPAQEEEPEVGRDPRAK